MEQNTGVKNNSFLINLLLTGSYLSDGERQGMIDKIRLALQAIAEAEGFSPNNQAISISFETDSP